MVQINSVEAHVWFERARVARLATAGDDRLPHLVPVVFAVRGEEIVTAVDHKPKRSTALRRLRNIAQNPSVSLLVDHYEDDWSMLWWVRADGEAEIADSANRPDHVRALVAKYPQYQQRPPTDALIVIRVRNWSGWHA